MADDRSVRIIDPEPAARGPRPSAPEAPPLPGERERRIGAPALIGGLTVGLVLSIVVSAGMGAFSIAPGEVVAILAGKVGLASGSAADPLAESVLWDIRLPRVLLAVVVGAALGCAGAAMQGTFANPLAEPGIIGVSSGAVVGAVVAIVVGVSALGGWTTPVAAFVGGLATVAGVYWSARHDGRTEVVTLVLTGIAVNALAGALIGLCMFLSSDAELRSITFWTLGSVASATWERVALVAPLALAGTVVAATMAHRLDLLALGDRQARHLGVDVERLRVVMLAVTALLTAAAVAVSGVVLFVGLVVPHLVRMLAGPRHRLLLVGSALLGSVLVVLADLVARTIAAPAEIPLGVLTALIGSPFFLWKLRQTRASQGGWA